MSVSLYGNLFFVIVEIVMAIYTSSQAVLLDAIYDGVEFCMLLPSLFLIPLLYKPSNEKHPFGYMQIESIFLGRNMLYRFQFNIHHPWFQAESFFRINFS